MKSVGTAARKLFSEFRSESGAATSEFVVLSAVVIALGVAAAMSVSGGTSDKADDIGEQIASLDVPEAPASPPSSQSPNAFDEPPPLPYVPSSGSNGAGNSGGTNSEPPSDQGPSDPTPTDPGASGGSSGEGGSDANGQAGGNGGSDAAAADAGVAGSATGNGGSNAGAGNSQGNPPTSGGQSASGNGNGNGSGNGNGNGGSNKNCPTAFVNGKPSQSAYNNSPWGSC